MSSPVVTISEGMEKKKRIKTKIWLGSVVKEKVGDMGDNNREGRHTRLRKEVVGCAQDVVGNKKFLVEFKYGKKKEMSSCLLVFLCPKKEIDMDEPL